MTMFGASMANARKMMNLKLYLTLASLLLPMTPASAQQANADGIAITQAWSRATPGGAQVASGYMTIKNNGPAADRLLGGSTDVAAKVEVHEMATKDGVVTMREIEDGVPVAPGATVTLAPGGFHLMLVNVKKPLKQGDVVTVTLNFEKAGKKEVDFNVLGVGAKGPDKGPDDSSAAASGAMGHDKMQMDHGKTKM
jgi:periplasmic copper chaperone A